MIITANFVEALPGLGRSQKITGQHFRFEGIETTFEDLVCLAVQDQLEHITIGDLAEVVYARNALVGERMGLDQAWLEALIDLLSEHSHVPADWRGQVFSQLLDNCASQAISQDVTYDRDMSYAVASVATDTNRRTYVAALARKACAVAPDRTKAILVAAWQGDI